MASFHSGNLEAVVKEVGSSGTIVVETKQCRDGYGMVPLVNVHGREGLVRERVIIGDLGGFKVVGGRVDEV